MDKVFDTTEYVAMLRGLVLEGKEVSMEIAGSSMAPFLVHKRDSILFSKPERELKKGDMVFYQRENGQYVMHRIVGIGQMGYEMLGDGQTIIERYVRPEQIFALVTKVKRKGKWIDRRDACWRFFAGPWRVLWRLRPLMLKLYGIFAGKAK